MFFCIIPDFRGNVKVLEGGTFDVASSSFGKRIVGANVVRPVILCYSGKHCPRENSFNPSGGIARTSLSALGLQTPLFALSCMYNVGILNICFEYSYCFFIRRLLCLLFFCFLVQNFSQRISLLFFFAKKKKRSKKKKSSRLPLSCAAMYHTTGSVIMIDLHLYAFTHYIKLR